MFIPARRLHLKSPCNCTHYLIKFLIDAALLQVPRTFCTKLGSWWRGDRTQQSLSPCGLISDYSRDAVLLLIDSVYGRDCSSDSLIYHHLPYEHLRVYYIITTIQAL